STRAVGVADIFTGFAPSTTFLLTTVVGPFILAGILTWLTMTHLLVAFSVPNPQDPEFGNSSSRYPWAPEVSRGVPLPPGTVPIPTLAEDFTGHMAELITDAATEACLPTSLLNAFITVETGANLDASFDEDGWWLTAGPSGGDCYDTPT